MWLTGGAHIQPGDAGQRDDSQSGETERADERFHHAAEHDAKYIQFKMYDLFISEIFH